LNQPSQPLATPYFFNGIGQIEQFPSRGLGDRFPLD
jgi:hypothetical protein